jgi:hypothetical protein
MTPPAEYRKVSRKRRGLGGSSQIWLAVDHLLLVETAWFVQNYRRFRLSEIQAILVSRRPSRIVWQTALLTLTILALAWCFRPAAGWFARLAGGVVFGGALLAELADLARGPSCRVTLRTAVSAVRLRPLSRMRYAESFLADVGPAVETAQAGMEPLTDAALPAANAVAPAPAPARRVNWRLQYILFASAMVCGVASFSSFLWNLDDMVSLVWTLTVMVIVLGVYSLIAERAHGWTLPRALCLLCTLGVTADLGITAVVMIQNLVSANLSDPVAIQQQFKRWPGWFIRYSLAESSLQTLLGLTGLLLSNAQARREEANSDRMERIE